MELPNFRLRGSKRSGLESHYPGSDAEVLAHGEGHLKEPRGPRFTLIGEVKKAHSIEGRATTHPLRRPNEADIHLARVLRHDEHSLFAGVADSPRRRREVVVGHPLRGGVHAAGAMQDLERSRAAAGEGVGADART